MRFIREVLMWLGVASVTTAAFTPGTAKWWFMYVGVGICITSIRGWEK